MRNNPHLYIPDELMEDEETIDFAEEFIKKETEPTESEIQQQIINTLGQELAQLKLQFMMGGI